MQKRITLKDIAAEAGVSPTAVSLVLNGKARQYKISEATCERICAIVRKHHFSPNPHARAMSSRKTGLVGVLIPDNIASSFWINILSAMEETFAENDLHILLSVTRNDSIRQHESLRFFENQEVDAVVAAFAAGTEDELSAFAKRCPLVTLNRKTDGIAAAWNDDYAGGRAAVSAAFLAGHRKIAYTGISSPVIPRARAYDDFMRAHDLQPVYFPDAASFLQNGRDFTVSVCVNDYILLEFYQRSTRAGRSIPDDLALVGYDNMDFLKFLSPVPATVNQYKEDLGRAAANLILEMLRTGPRTGKDAPEARFEPRFVPGAGIPGFLQSGSGVLAGA